jgi:endo-1,4-beta-xylanase
LSVIKVIATVKPGTLAGSFNDRRYRDILEKECSAIVPENELKSYTIVRERDRYDFEPGDRIAGSHGIELRGHNQLWNRATPGSLRPDV